MPRRMRTRGGKNGKGRVGRVIRLTRQIVGKGRSRFRKSLNCSSQRPIAATEPQMPAPAHKHALAVRSPQHCRLMSAQSRPSSRCRKPVRAHLPFHAAWSNGRRAEVPSPALKSRGCTGWLWIAQPRPQPPVSSLSVLSALSSKPRRSRTKVESASPLALSSG